MSRLRPQGDTGQAFPVYITVAAGLLFLALAFLAVGQAAVNRSGAQTAADAAALAAAQNRRDQLAGKWVEDVLDPTEWAAVFDGDVASLKPSCWRADQLAAQNDASADCASLDPLTFAVTAVTRKSVGTSVVPGTEKYKSTATAKAVIEARCTFDPPTGDGGGADDTLPSLNCKGRRWDLDPDHLTDLPGPTDLFDVHLVG
ncbi:pilus assembly protein TadG-related protein [Streptomyces sp. NPDC004549]|uniref:pilus assembly protein TadG-related protein n=1 Tax=Streptomyces sp. NPDC004549 TaxID=3154283 RepID=UPI0033BC8FB7